jgi:cell division protein FtsI/penicillin-binding protein 2
MRMTVTQGTAKILNDIPFSLAGKSGSPQILGKQKLNAIFSGFGPYEKPKLCATLLIEEVPYGSVASLPLFKKIMYIYYERFLENGRNSF